MWTEADLIGPSSLPAANQRVGLKKKKAQHGSCQGGCDRERQVETLAGGSEGGWEEVQQPIRGERAAGTQVRLMAAAVRRHLLMTSSSASQLATSKPATNGPSRTRHVHLLPAGAAGRAAAYITALIPPAGTPSSTPPPIPLPLPPTSPPSSPPPED